MSTLTKATVVQNYKKAEKAALAALESANELKFSVGVTKKPTTAQQAQMRTYLTTAWTQGHQAELWRGNNMTLFHAADLNGVDIGHKDAVTWIDDNIMTPTANLAALWKITLPK